VTLINTGAGMKYVPPLSIQREVYCMREAKDVDHSEILTGFYLVGLVLLVAAAGKGVRPVILLPE